MKKIQMFLIYSLMMLSTNEAYAEHSGLVLSNNENPIYQVPVENTSSSEETELRSMLAEVAENGNTVEATEQVADAFAMTPDEIVVTEFMTSELGEAWQSDTTGTVLELYTRTKPEMWYDAQNNTVDLNSSLHEDELREFFSNHELIDVTASRVSVMKVNDFEGFVTYRQRILLVEAIGKAEREVVMQTLYEVERNPDDGQWRAYRELRFVGDSGS